MKHLLSILVVIVLLFTSAANAQGLSAEETMALYSGVVGHIAFALPNMPQVLHDQDYEGLWTGSVQLVGNASGGEEFQFRTGDISAWIDGSLHDNPSLSGYDARANALLGFARFFIDTYDGKLANLKRWPERDFIHVSFTYTYADTPGVAYRGKAILEGTTAVCLMGAVCNDLNAAINRLRVVTDEEAQALAKPEPETVTLGVLTADFPGKVFIREMDGYSYAACFAADFTYLGVQYLPVAINIDLQGDKMKQSLMELAQSHVLPAITAEGIYDEELSFPAEDTALLAFYTINTNPFGKDYGQRWLCRLYVGRRGVYYVYAAQTDTGRAFMDSLTVAQTDSGRI